MSNFKFGDKSLQNLKGVHQDLVKVCNRALQLSKHDFMIIEGVRTIERQKQLFAKGATKTLNSRHLTGHAIDFCPWPVDWNDKTKFNDIAKSFFDAAKELNVKIRWGGDWNENEEWKDERFYDGPHIELRRKEYP